MATAIITGAAGFIGSHLTSKLLSDGWLVTAVDNFDPFYSPQVKWQNLRHSLNHPNLEFLRLDICDFEETNRHLSRKFDVFVHLAAKAGVRPSIENPLAYQRSNVEGTQNVLELCRLWKTPHFVFASSSSVYGVNPNVPWSEEDNVLLPISPYASTKISGELLGHVYSHLYGLRFMALRFFTVYGPRQRPDLAIHKFASLIKSGNPVPIFGDGSTSRDYTFVSDIISGIVSAMEYSTSPFEIFNLGNCHPTKLIDLVHQIAAAMDIEPNLQYFPMQPGDVPQTCARITKAAQKLKYQPEICLTDGLRSFASWLNGTEVQTDLSF